MKNFSLPVEENLDLPQSLKDNGKSPIVNLGVLSHPSPGFERKRKNQETK